MSEPSAPEVVREAISDHVFGGRRWPLAGSMDRGVATAISRGNVASWTDYVRIQGYSLKQAVGRRGIVAMAELQLELQRQDYLLESVRKCATEKDMVYSFGPRVAGNPMVSIGVWGGSGFYVGLANPFRGDRLVLLFSEYDEHEDWQSYRDDFLMFLRQTIGPEGVRIIPSPREFSR